MPTSRLSLTTVATSDAASAYRAAINANAAINDNAALYSEGILSARPVSTGGTPGIKGRFYRATDDTTAGSHGTLHYDYGTGWLIIPANAATTFGLSLLTQADATAARTTLGLGSAAVLAASALPGAEVGYDQITSAVTVSSATEATGTVVISCGAHTFDGSPVMAEFFAPGAQPFSATNGNSQLWVSLFEGATQIGRLCQTVETIIGTSVQLAMQVALVGKLRFTPSAGAHTYTVKAHQVGGNGTINAGAGGTGVDVPAFIRFAKV